jgi:hypothetical protein
MFVLFCQVTMFAHQSIPFPMVVYEVRSGFSHRSTREPLILSLTGITNVQGAPGGRGSDGDRGYKGDRGQAGYSVRRFHSDAQTVN